MTDIDRLQNVQPQILDKLYLAVEENLRDLEEAVRTGRLSTVAWLTRNILELAVWSDYCMQSVENAKNFLLEAARDTHDALNIPDGIFSGVSSLKETREAFIETAKEDGFETLEESYTAVSKIAKSLGKGNEFKNLNKLLSKFAHPTALSVTNPDSPANEMFKEKFGRLGIEMSRSILQSLETKR